MASTVCWLRRDSAYGERQGKAPEQEDIFHKSLLQINPSSIPSPTDCIHPQDKQDESLAPDLNQSLPNAACVMWADYLMACFPFFPPSAAMISRSLIPCFSAPTILEIASVCCRITSRISTRLWSLILPAPESHCPDIPPTPACIRDTASRTSTLRRSSTLEPCKNRAYFVQTGSTVPLSDRSH